MNGFTIFIYEWKHFLRNPFKVVALLLFMVAGIYGLHNGADLYHQHQAEISKINEEIDEEREKYGAYLDEGKAGPENAPWVDMTTPYWSVWFSYTYHFKTPSPALVYSVGQAEQYGFYKKVNFWASPYDADMGEEIANPERLQTGTLDFAFVLLYLSPLLLLVLLYNVTGLESEQGFMPLIEVQTAAKTTWLLSRVSFYSSMVFGLVVLLLIYGAVLTGVFTSASQAFGKMLVYAFIYLLIWTLSYFLTLRKGKSIISNTLKMVGIWLLFTFILPAALHQWISIEKPANLMVEVIDATRDERQKLYDRPDSIKQAQLDAMFPKIVDSPVARDSTKISRAMSYSTSAYVNDLMKKSTAAIEKEYQERNQLIAQTFWLNPVAFFHNRFNLISETHFNDYQAYRTQIQDMIDKQIEVMVVDMWHDVKVDKVKYVAYQKLLAAK
ncbi:MAG: hypothetical protein AAF849_21405 [Bacteroidota bacterium]